MTTESKAVTTKRRSGEFETTCSVCGGPAVGWADVENGPSPEDVFRNENVLCEECDMKASEAAFKFERKWFQLAGQGVVTEREAMNVIHEVGECPQLGEPGVAGFDAERFDAEVAKEEKQGSTDRASEVVKFVCRDRATGRFCSLHVEVLVERDGKSYRVTYRSGSDELASTGWVGSWAEAAEEGDRCIGINMADAVSDRSGFARRRVSVVTWDLAELVEFNRKGQEV